MKSEQHLFIKKTIKCANVVSIHKKGSRNESGNYRPMSLTSVVCKVMESILRDEVLNYVNLNNLFTVEQHGFMKKRSFLTNFLETFEEWTEALDEGYEVDAVYLDYRKAFDTVQHKQLLAKLESYGIEGDIYQWIKKRVFK